MAHALGGLQVGSCFVGHPPAGAGREENFPYVMGNIEKAMPTLTSLVHGARNPFHTVVAIRLVMLPGATEAPSKSPRF